MASPIAHRPRADRAHASPQDWCRAAPNPNPNPNPSPNPNPNSNRNPNPNPNPNPNSTGLVPSGPPSLIKCSKLTVEGSVIFAKGVVFVGACKVSNAGSGAKTLAAGTYENKTIEL